MTNEEKVQEAIELVKSARGLLEPLVEKSDTIAEIVLNLDEDIEDLCGLDFDSRGRIEEPEPEDDDDEFEDDDEDWEDDVVDADDY